MKLCLVCSSGGHLLQLYMLKDWFRRYDRFWVTFKKTDAASMLKNEKVYHAYYPTNRNILNLIRNFFRALYIIPKERPDFIISTGAGIAVPFFYVGKLFGAKLIYLEVYDRFDTPTLTGKLVYPIVDKFLIQWDELKKYYPKAENWGQVI